MAKLLKSVDVQFVRFHFIHAPCQCHVILKCEHTCDFLVFKLSIFLLSLNDPLWIRVCARIMVSKRWNICERPYGATERNRLEQAKQNKFLCYIVIIHLSVNGIHEWNYYFDIRFELMRKYPNGKDDTSRVIWSGSLPGYIQRRNEKSIEQHVLS